VSEDAVLGTLLVAYLGLTGWALKTLIDLKVGLKEHTTSEDAENKASHLEFKRLVDLVDEIYKYLFPHPPPPSAGAV